MPTRVPYFQVDAFADRVFSGNPAGVCVLPHWLPDGRLQAAAAENNLSETAFLVSGDDGRWELRWFTPAAEVDLCGHATLAAAHVLSGSGDGGGGTGAGEAVRFRTRSGPLSVSREDGLLWLDLPARPGTPCEPPPELTEALGAPPVEVVAARDYLAAFGSAAEVRALEPDMELLRGLERLGVIATAPGEEEGVDFVSRFFAPGVGVPEDPVTGSSHCTLIPFWAARTGKREMRARQLSDRGGELWCEERGDRVRVGGRAVTYLEGMARV